MGHVVPPAWPGSAGSTLPARTPPVSPSGQSLPDREEQRPVSERCHRSEPEPREPPENLPLMSAMLFLLSPAEALLHHPSVGVGGQKKLT